MDLAALTARLLDALSLTLLLSAPALIAAAALGLLSGVLQGATQVQDASLSFVPRLLAVALALALFGPGLAEQLLAFTGELWGSLAGLAR
ncbi:MAG: flagellar biosynthetic protein FliQ [Myxococcales bacterium]|jgi:flagellar biosynthesis protein FliQ